MELSLDCRRYRLPFRSPVRTAQGVWSDREGLYVRVGRPDGTAGYGEAAPLPFPGSESLDAVEAGCRSLGARIDEGVLDRIPRELATLRNALECALEAAPRAVAHTSLPVAALLPSGRACLEAGRSRAEAGFRVFKWKVGVGAADDEWALFDDLIGALPSASRFRLDANGAWTSKLAARWLERCAERPVDFVEQPLAPESKGANDRLIGLSADFPVPIALDESIRGDTDVERWLGAGWPGVFVVKPSLLGHPAATLERLAARKSRVVFSSSLETGLGARAALAAAFAWPGPAAALGFGVWPLFSDPAFDGPVAVPFFRAADLATLRPETLWNALN